MCLAFAPPSLRTLMSPGRQVPVVMVSGSANSYWAKEKLSPSSDNPSPETPFVPVNAILSPEQTWAELEEVGTMLTEMSKTSLFTRALAAGVFVGLGGVLCASVGFDMGVKPWERGNGFARFLSGVVGFPLSILLVSITGNGAWTGDALLVAVAAWKKRTTFKSALRMLAVTYVGCFTGAVLIAALATGAALPACAPCVDIALHKLALSPLQTFLRGVGGGCLICLAIFISKCSRMMTGKAVGIVFPISAYVICDFEHVLASFFFLSAAKMNGANFTLVQALRQLLPATLGNLVGGALLVGVGMSSIPKRLRKDLRSQE